MDNATRTGERIAYGCLTLLLIGVALFIGWVLWNMAAFS